MHRKYRKHRKSRLLFLGIAVVATATVAVVAWSTGLGVSAWLGLRGLHGIRLAAFIVGAVSFAGSIYFFRRVMRRRARLNAISELLPRYRPRCLEDEFMFDEPEIDDDYSGCLPAGRSQMRAATRALLVSLEEEMRREGVKVRRAVRPACRRARLRIAGRTESGRRRVPARLVPSPS